jgi:hypothetical protein
VIREFRNAEIKKAEVETKVLDFKEESQYSYYDIFTPYIASRQLSNISKLCRSFWTLPSFSILVLTLAEKN